MGKIQGMIELNLQTPAWFAVFTRHRHEKAVAQVLTARRMDALLPLYNAAHRWRDRVKVLSLPLFPNYVFVSIRSNQRGAVLSIPGVYDFVRLAGQPAPIPCEEIEAVRRAVEHGQGIEPHPFLKSGDRVRVKSGPLEGIEGFIIRKKNFYRLVLSVELLVRSVSVEVEVADVERVAERVVRVTPHATSAAIQVGY